MFLGKAHRPSPSSIDRRAIPHRVLTPARIPSPSNTAPKSLLAFPFGQQNTPDRISAGTSRSTSLAHSRASAAASSAVIRSISACRCPCSPNRTSAVRPSSRTSSHVKNSSAPFPPAKTRASASASARPSPTFARSISPSLIPAPCHQNGRRPSTAPVAKNTVAGIPSSRSTGAAHVKLSFHPSSNVTEKASFPRRPAIQSSSRIASPRRPSHSNSPRKSSGRVSRFRIGRPASPSSGRTRWNVSTSNPSPRRRLHPASAVPATAFAHRLISSSFRVESVLPNFPVWGKLKT